MVMQHLLQALLGQQGSWGPTGGSGDDDEAPPRPESTPKASEPPKPKAAASSGGNEASEAAKNLGNQAFKEGKLDEALSHYDHAIELDPFNVTYYNNKATVLARQGRHEEAIKLVEDAIEKGRGHSASYEVIARAYQKIAVSHVALNNLEAAIEALKLSILEKKDPEVQKELKKLQDKWEKQKAQAYEDPALSEQAKTEGNTAFQQQNYPKAVDLYTEAIKRAPRNPALYSNRAAAYSKLGEMPMAVRDCEKALEIDPNFVKAYTRKAYCHFAMKEYYKARECYNQALKIDSNNAEAIDGLQSIDMQIARNRYKPPDEEQVRRAAADPEIQRILQDPGINQILKECQENPSKLAQYMADPSINDAFRKLQAAGILRF
jgi:stress-induced-phosphoprotein 1